MARKRIVSESRKKLIREFLTEFQPKDARELQNILKNLMADTVQSMLEAEIEDELGYSKYDYKNKDTSNTRNGYYPKTINSTNREFTIDIPLNREGEYEPKVIKKFENDILSIEDKILPIAHQWQGRPLERLYALVYMDAIHFNVKEDNQVIKKAVYTAIGIKLNGEKEVLALWVGGNESSKY